MRVSLIAVAGGTLVAALGAVGLIRGAVPQSSASASGPGMISVVGAYVRAPVPPTELAAGYFTVYNTTSAPDRLQSVQTGAGSTAVLHDEDASGAMIAMSPNGVEIPAHGKLVLRTGHVHVMIGGLFDAVKAGQTVNMTLQFEKAGVISVVAPVIAIGAPAPS